MIWLHPLALFALASAAAPILIHILVQRRAERFPFPTLRFVTPTRLAAIRRHMLEDAALLAVRIAILAAAVAAVAGPLLLTAARRSAWDRRIVRAVVVSDDVDRTLATEAVTRETSGVFRAQRIDAATLTDGVRRASAWLAVAPPARRELVVISPLAIGSMTAADAAAIPPNIGVRFERSGTLPPSRTIDGATLLAEGNGQTRAVTERVTFNGPQTSVVDAGEGRPASWPIDIRAPRDARRVLDAAVTAVLSQRVREPAVTHAVRLVVLPSGVSAPSTDVADAAAIRTPWMADAIARIARDDDLQAAASRVSAGLTDAHFAGAPWSPLAAAIDGRPLIVAAASRSQLVIVSGAAAADVVTPILLRAIANATAAPPDLHRAEIVPIADAQFRDWSRPAPPVGTPSLNTIDEDDCRWLWLTALALLAVETWMRRVRATTTREHAPEVARVA
jgi:hypothetical protein